jgi:hypothetical protein
MGRNHPCAGKEQVGFCVDSNAFDRDSWNGRYRDNAMPLRASGVFDALLALDIPLSRQAEDIIVGAASEGELV